MGFIKKNDGKGDSQLKGLSPHFIITSFAVLLTVLAPDVAVIL
jgi:hypothetical protein